MYDLAADDSLLLSKYDFRTRHMTESNSIIRVPDLSDGRTALFVLPHESGLDYIQGGQIHSTPRGVSLFVFLSLVVVKAHNGQNVLKTVCHHCAPNQNHAELFINPSWIRFLKQRSASSLASLCEQSCVHIDLLHKQLGGSENDMIRLVTERPTFCFDAKNDDDAHPRYTGSRDAPLCQATPDGTGGVQVSYCLIMHPHVIHVCVVRVLLGLSRV